MKFFIILGIVLLAVWLWRSGRRDSTGPDRPAPPPSTPPDPQEMVRCAHCGVHLPRGDALIGRVGYYCSPEHRQLAEP
jgi:uncharacterized protein